MNKNIVFSTVLALIYTSSHAVVSDSGTIKNPLNSGNNTAPAVIKGKAPAPITNEGKAVNSALPPATLLPAQKMDCNYKIPPQTTRVESSLITQWAEKASQQSFDFNSATIDQQLVDLKPCFTDQGWQSFNDALQKSGNLDAIKKQKLNVSSTLNGQSTIAEIKENLWKITIPLQVLYQNDKEKILQSLKIELVIGRKMTGEPGIMQMIASPEDAKLMENKPINVPAPVPATPLKK